MTTLTDTQVVTASGGLVELGYSQITSTVTVDNATAGTGKEVIAPLTVVCDGGPVLVEFFAPVATPANTAGDQLWISLFQDGAEKSRYWAAITNSGNADYDRKPIHLQYRVTPTAGSHTFGVKAFVTSAARYGYVVSSNSTTSEAPAFLRVSKIVTATQWPAVTTGTIICTSTTRPGSPFEGQTIWEGDTDRTYVWNGAAWVSPSVSFKPPMCLVSRSAVQSINNATDTAAAFTAGATFDTNGMFSSGANTKITIKTAGVYLVTLAVSWAANSAGERFANVRLNNNVARPLCGSGGTTAGSTRFSGASPLSLAVNDELTLNLYQSSGGALNADGIEMSAIWVGQSA